jgi:hypothetical protein
MRSPATISRAPDHSGVMSFRDSGGIVTQIENRQCLSGHEIAFFSRRRGSARFVMRRVKYPT